jgi:hypothetical protein
MIIVCDSIRRALRISNAISFGYQVGLTVLNEQLIEMMLATFVYPLLLQPLLLYYKRLMPALEQARSRFSDHPFGGYDGDIKRVEAMVATASGPAKTALFTLASAFQCLTNRPLLRLLYTALFHPLSPDSTSVPTVRSRLEVATIDAKGRRTIRLDRTFLDADLIPNDRTTYAFGTDPQSRRRSKAKLSQMEDEDETSEACVFVLSPALAEVLEFRGQDYSLITRAKPNPYRHALLHCLQIPDEFFDVRHLSVCLVESAVRIFEGSFVSHIIFGSDLKKFDDDVPQDERKLDSRYAHAVDDRGIGEGTSYDSRQSLDRQKGGTVGTDLVGEVVNSICCCIVFACRVEGGDEWEVGYNVIAAHALLCTIRHNSRAMVVASKTIEQRWKRAASLVTARATSILSPMGGSSVVIRGSPSINDPLYDEKVFNAVLHLLLYGSPEHPDVVPSLEDLLIMHDDADIDDPDCYCTAIASESISNDLCGQVETFLLWTKSDAAARSREHATLRLKRDGFCCLFKLDALLALLRDLSATGGVAIHKSKLASLVVTRDRSSKHMEMLNVEMSRQLHCVLSSKAVETLFGKDERSGVPAQGSQIGLSGSVVPCVCEAPADIAAFFSVEGSGVVAEGVTWQSLCLVIQNGILVFAQPIGGDSDGRVISACPIERVWVERDSDPEAEFASPARRLLLSYSWFEKNPPALFLFDTLPNPEKRGPFVRPKAWTSRLDVWLESQLAADQAFTMLSNEIFISQSKRGQRVQEFLSFA